MPMNSRYTNHIGMICPKGALLNRNELNAKLGLLREVIGYIHKLSGTAKAGLLLTSVFSGSIRALDRFRYGFLRSTEADFLGLSTAADCLNAVRSIFGEDKLEIMADSLYAVWQFYQEGWPISGYFSRIGVEPGQAAFDLYANTCRRNAFEISTAMPYLPEKWIRFLKD